jgi:hypothetical protein
MGFHFESFVGLHIYLVIADLIYGVLASALENLEKNIIDPLLESYFKNLYELKISAKSKIKLGDFTYSLIKSIFNAILIYGIYQYTLKYKKFESLKK